MLANVKKEEKGGAATSQNTESSVSLGGLDRLYDRLQGSLALSTVEQKSEAFNAELNARKNAFEAVAKKVEADIEKWRKQQEAENKRIQDLLKLMGDL